jgi:hypothetical protein
MTIFYIPTHKLDAPDPGGGPTPRGRIHYFLMRHYRAYTHTPSPVKGFWLSAEPVVMHDVLERFEVSFGSEKAFRQLVDFLRQLCHALDEEAVYLTRGEESFLVNRR